MLKPAEPQPPSGPEPSIGDLIERLFDEALDYGRAEIELLKARARDAVEGYVRAAILFGIAAVLALAGVVTLFVGIAFALALAFRKSGAPTWKHKAAVAVVALPAALSLAIR